jgi:hypothetical protein
MISAVASYLKNPGFDSIPRIFKISSVARRHLPVETLTKAQVHFLPCPSLIHTKFFRRGLYKILSNFAKSTRKQSTIFHAFFK